MYASPNIIRVNKSGRMRRPGHVARMGDMRDVYIFRLENLKGRYRLEDLGVDGRIILECILGE